MFVLFCDKMNPGKILYVLAEHLGSQGSPQQQQGICLCYLRRPQWRVFRFFATPGRMALTNYIGQSVFGMLRFYGIGLGLGAAVGLVYVVLIAAGVWIVQALFSSVWLYYCQFGPLEWIWRMLTYGKLFKLVKERKG